MAKVEQIEPVGDPKTHLLQLRREMDEELRHWLLGSVLKRIRRFCEKYDSDADSVVMTREVERDFLKDRDREFMIILAVRQMEIVGHLLARIIVYYGRSYIYVHQMDIDPDSGITLEQEKEAFQLIVSWRKEVRAHGIRSNVPDTTNARRLQMMYNFEPMHTLMKWKGLKNG